MAKNKGNAGPMRYAEGTATLTLRVQPAASRTEWAGRYGESALRLRLAAPAVDGKANRACCRFLADTFGVAPSRVEMLRGESSRTKTVVVRDVPPERWKAFLKQWNSL